MDRDLIKALIEALASSNLAELEYRNGGETLRLVKRSAEAPPAARERELVARVLEPEAETAPQDADTIATPLFGIVHLQQTPGAPPLVAIGQAVTAGQLLCVVEAMKVFNQIRAERDCVIASVLVESGQEVEAGQSLFRLA